MKKKLILLPLLALTLTACDLSSLMGGGNNNGGVESAEPRERSSIDPNDLAIKIADMFSIFPEVGDDIDMSEYVTFDTGTDYKLADFTFTSSNQSAIKIVNGYHATCVGEGYTEITVSGPGLNTPVILSFYVGSIAGNYTPDSGALKGIVNLNIARGENGAYTFNLNVAPTDRVNSYNKRAINQYNGGGSLVKNISPFVPMEFDGEAPSNFSPVTNYLSELVGEVDEIKDLTQDVYGFMAADSYYGVVFKMRFNEKFIDLVIPQE